MSTRWNVPFIAVVLLALPALSFGQPAPAPEPTPRAWSASTAPMAEPGVSTAPFAVQTPSPAQAPQAPTPVAEPKVVQPGRATVLATTLEVPQARRQKSPLINVRLEFTITDQIGGKPPAKKTVMMLVADGESGRIRTNNEFTTLFKANFQRTSLPLNIDAAPEVDGNKIRLRVSLDLQSRDEPSTPDLPPGNSKMQESVSSIVTDGVATILSQSADPLTDRKVTLEVKATILK